MTVVTRTCRMVACLALVGAMLVACGGDEQAATPSDGGPVRVAVATFGADTLDPAMDSRSITLNQLLPMWDTLLEIGPEAQIEPGVAESWEMDPSARSWTFHLRDDVKFHDGSDLTAEDVKFSIERFKSPDAQSTGAAILRDIVESVDVVDDYTVVVHTIRPSVSLPYLFAPHQNEAGIIFPSDYMTSQGGPDFKSQSELLERAPVGSGPFKFVSRERGDNIVYEAVDNHWRETPTIGQLEFLLVPEPATQIAMLASGEADIISVTGDQIPDVESNGNEVRRIEGAVGVAVQITGTYREPAKSKPTASPDVRHALSLAINRQEILDTLLAGEGNLPQTPWGTLPVTGDINVADYAPWAEEIGLYDPEEAKRLLAQAGYPDGFSGINMHVFTRPGTPFLPQLGEIIASQWAAIGVKVDIVATDYGTYRDHYVNAPENDPYNAGDTSTYSSGPRFDALGTLQTYWQGTDGSVQLMNDPSIDERIKQVDGITNDAERQALVKSLFDETNDNWMILPLFDMNGLYGVNPQTVSSWTTIPGWAYLGRVAETIGQSD